MEAQDQTQLIGGAEQSRSSANRKTSRADTPLFHVVPDSGPPSGEGSANTPGTATVRRRTTVRPVKQPLSALSVEPMTGIEPAYSAWEVFSTPEQVSDSRW
jgi:hypothetical protein